MIIYSCLKHQTEAWSYYFSCLSTEFQCIPIIIGGDICEFCRPKNQNDIIKKYTKPWKEYIIKQKGQPYEL